MPTDTLYALIKETLLEGNFHYLFPNILPRGVKSADLQIDQDFIDRVYLCLIELPVTMRTCYAYNFLCQKVQPNDQYINNEHFLYLYFKETKRYPIEYGIIYTFNKGSPDTLASKGTGKEDRSESIATCLTHSLIQMYQEPELECQMKIICDIPLKTRADSRYHSLIRSIIPRNNGDGINPYIIVDHLSFDNCAIVKSCLQRNIGTIDNIVDRYNFLKTHTKYYFEVVSDYYQKMFQVILEDKLLGDLSPALIAKVSVIIDDLYKEVDNLTLASKSLLLHPKEVQYYLLGFPIQLGFPSKPMFLSMLKEFNDSPVEYLNKIATYNRGIINQIMNDTFFQPRLSLRNTEDSLFEKFEDYSPQDVIPYLAGNSLYIFTRPELKTLLEKKKNFLTNEKLQDSFIDTLEIYQNHSNYLPNCKPLKIFYEELAEGKNLYKKTNDDRNEINERISELFVQFLSTGTVSY